MTRVQRPPDPRVETTGRLALTLAVLALLVTWIGVTHLSRRDADLCLDEGYDDLVWSVRAGRVCVDFDPVRLRPIAHIKAGQEIKTGSTGPRRSTGRDLVPVSY